MKLLDEKVLFDAYCDNDDIVRGEFVAAISSVYKMLYWEKCLHHEEMNPAFVSRHLDDCCESKQFQQNMMDAEAQWCVKHLIRLKAYGYRVLTERLLYENKRFIKRFQVADEFIKFCADNKIEICYCRDYIKNLKAKYAEELKCRIEKMQEEYDALVG